MAITRVAFLGLGVMGFPMAGHLSAAGLQVTVYNRTSSKAQQWLNTYTGKIAATPAQAVAGAQVVFACVGRDEDVHEVTVGEQGAFAAMDKDAVFVDHTTTSAELARELSATAKVSQLHFIDAPVSGGEQGAVNGALTVMCGGEADIFARVQPILLHVGKAATLLGPVGSGQLCKMVNQICIGGLVQSLAEGLHFARQSGLDPYQVINVIAKGAAQSWQMENRHKTMLAGKYEHGFAVDWMRKDLGIVLDEARRNGAQIPVTALVDQFYADIQARGGGRWDTSSLLKRLEQSPSATNK